MSVKKRVPPNFLLVCTRDTDANDLLDILTHFQCLGGKKRSPFKKWELMPAVLETEKTSKKNVTFVFTIGQVSTVDVQDLFNIEHKLRSKIQSVLLSSDGRIYVETQVGTTKTAAGVATSAAKRVRHSG